MAAQQIMEAIRMVLLNPFCLLLILMGVVIGIIFGSIPGLSSTMALILFLWYPLSRRRVATLQQEKEQALKESYEQKLIDIG